MHMSIGHLNVLFGEVSNHVLCPFFKIPLLGIYPKEAKTLIQKNIRTPMVIAVLFTITKIWKQSKCPSVDEWIKQPWDIYTMEFYSVLKKKKVLPFVTVWMALESITLSEISQSEKDKYHMISLICGS